MKHLCRFTVVAIVAMLLTALAYGQASSASVWDKAIMKQPFDLTPFREVKIPKWMEDLTRVTYCFTVISPEMREKAAAAGAQISELGFVDPFYVYYDSDYLKLRNPDSPADRCEKEIAFYKKLGVRVLAGVPPGLQREVYAAHPEWRKIWTNTTAIPEADLNTSPFGGPLCLLGPWGDRLIDILCEILNKYPGVDAFTFDGLHDGGFCYCQYCRDAYRRDTGEEIPNANMDDPAFRKYQYWVDRRMESVVEKMQTRIKAVKPDVALLTWSTNAGRYGHFLSIPRNMSARMNLLFDAPDQEFWMDESNRGSTVLPAFANAYMWSVSNHRVAFSTPYVMSHGNPYGVDSFPPHELLRRVLLVLTYGTRPSYSLAAAPNLFEPMLQSLAEVKEREGWLTHIEPEPWAALVMSDNTKTFYGRDGRVEERYLANVLGMFRTSIEEHLPTTVINDWNLNAADLSNYEVIVLPNMACINDEQAEAIRQFVKNGGGLVASVDTSLFDEMGNPRRDFLLADVFGVHYKGAATSSSGGKTEDLDVNFVKGIDATYWEKRKGIFDFKLGRHSMLDLARLKEYLGEAPVTFKAQAAAVSTEPDSQVVATISSRDAGAQAVPAIIARQYGKGKVVYFAGGLDSAYYLYPYPYQRLLLAQAVRWAAPSKPPITVEAPMCVHSTFFRQKKNGQRLVVQLYNDVNTAANHARPEDDVPLREEVIPIHNIKVTFKGYRISRFHLEPGGIELKPVNVADGIQITVPVLRIHSIVVAELSNR